MSEISKREVVEILGGKYEIFELVAHLITIANRLTFPKEELHGPEDISDALDILFEFAPPEEGTIISPRHFALTELYQRFQKEKSMSFEFTADTLKAVSRDDIKKKYLLMVLREFAIFLVKIYGSGSFLQNCIRELSSVRDSQEFSDTVIKKLHEMFGIKDE